MCRVWCLNSIWNARCIKENSSFCNPTKPIFTSVFLISAEDKRKYLKSAWISLIFHSTHFNHQSILSLFLTHKNSSEYSTPAYKPIVTFHQTETWWIVLYCCITNNHQSSDLNIYLILSVIQDPRYNLVVSVLLRISGYCVK
jgi:hypothetical protein